MLASFLQLTDYSALGHQDVGKHEPLTKTPVELTVRERSLLRTCRDDLRRLRFRGRAADTDVEHAIVARAGVISDVASMKVDRVDADGSKLADGLRDVRV